MPIILPNPPFSGVSVDLTAETRVNRRNTTYFIACNPYPVVLIPRVSTRVSNGGHQITQGSPKPQQICRLIPAQETTQPNFTDEGTDRQIDYVLLGEWDMDFSIYDQWRDTQGFLYEIVDVSMNPYEIKGAVIKHGNR